MCNGKKRILIFDDDSKSVKILKDAFEKDGTVEFETATSRFETGFLALRFRPHYILMDIKFNGKGKCAIFNLLQKAPELSGTKIIGLSESISAGKKNALRKKGYVGFLEKPFKAEDIESQIRSLKSDSP